MHPSPAMKRRHIIRKKSKRNNLAQFHPPIMFCGECSSCAEPPPPPISDALFTIGDDESPHDTVLQCTASMHLRVYNAESFRLEDHGAKDSDESTRRVDILKTILADLDGVITISVTESHLSQRSTGAKFATAVQNIELVDPTSCSVMIEYGSSATNSKNDNLVRGAAITDNPQEPKDDGRDSIRQSILTRLSEAGFDYAVDSSPSASVPNSISRRYDALTSPNNSHPADASLKISEPPASCRTRLRVQGICCSSEVPTVRAILKPLPGVRKLGVNIATKVVFIDHDPQVISATFLMGALNAEMFGAEILTDGGLLMNSTTSEDACNKFTSSASPSLDNIFDVPRSRFVESTFFIPGIGMITDKESCPIRKILHQNFFKDHLQAFHLHAPSRTLKTEHDPELLSARKIQDVLVQGLNGGWGNIDLVHDGSAEGLTLPVLSSENLHKDGEVLGENERKFCRGLKFTVILSGLFWVLSLMSFIGESWAYLNFAGILSVLFGMPPVVMKAWKTVRRLQFDANCMMVAAAFGALALGDFDEAASISFVFSLSEWLESRATGKARQALGEIVSLRPEYANLVDRESGGIVIVPAVNIPVGSIVSVRTGDKVPADGVVIEGTSSVDESSLTGEARMVEKHAGDFVSGGSINIGSRQLVVRTTCTVGDSTLSRLIKLVEEAQANASETEKLVDAFARKYTPVVLVIAFLFCTLPWFFGVETGRKWMLKGLIFTVIACPCALTISTPVTYSAGLAAAAQRGIIIKGGGKLEALGNVKTILFDKTGTVTTGRFTLSHLDAVGETKSRKELLELLAIMEAPSSHPLSACLVAAAKEEGIVPSQFSLTEHTILKGEGVTAYVNEERVYVGNERLFKRVDMYDISSHHMGSAKQWSGEGGTVGYIGIDGARGRSIVGIFCVKDTVRDESYDVIASLLRAGIEVTMLTGDSEGAAQAVGKEIGLPNTSILSQLLPEDKLHYVSGLKGSSANKHPSLSGKKKLILFIGDGVNDAPALAVADIGVAMGDGAALAMEMSDVTLMDSNLSKLIFSMELGAKVITTVKQNIAFSMLVNSIAVVLTLFGRMTLLWAIVSDVGVMLLVTLNGMKLLSERKIDEIKEKPKTRAPTNSNGHHYALPSSSFDDDGLELL